jgi:AcrR family transcriptional regulator
MSLPQGKQPKGRANSRQAILDAAGALVAEMGAAHLTLEAVAQRAGISKGGLLYNFPTKLDLLQAMIQSYVEGILTLASGQGDEPEAGASHALHTLLESRLGMAGKEREAKSSHGILAAMVEHPHLLDPVRELHRSLWARLKETRRDHEKVLLGWFAIEGLVTLELFNTSPLSAPERAHLVRTATELIDGKLELTEPKDAPAPRPARASRKKREELTAG